MEMKGKMEEEEEEDENEDGETLDTFGLTEGTEDMKENYISIDGLRKALS